ncbi:MAG: pyridoxamine 5'-phosphate oxidase family protein [Candidatus Aceula meridiana]|nr:pyridoxamine 5'-phosphate oxidase family protein [Candidatus Aceula meridiana]
MGLVKNAEFGFLATTEANQPRVRPVAPYLTDDNKLLLALFSHRRSIGQMKENPLVEICFVDRKMAYCRITEKAEIVNTPKSKKIMWNNSSMLRQYFSGHEDSNFCSVKLEIVAAEVMSANDQKLQSIEF